MTQKTIISLYTGIGGLDFGFEAAGFTTRVAIESDPTTCSTIRLNRKWPVLQGDISCISSRQILKSAGLKAGEPDVLIGGPPCQPFSRASYWLHGDALRLDDPRSHTLAAFLRVLRDTKPKTFLLENVYGLAYSKKDEGLQYLIDGIAEVNRQAGTRYAVQWKMVNAVHFGVPQFRERIFLIGDRSGKAFVFPKPTYGGHAREGVQPFFTAWDAIGGLPDTNDPSLKVKGKWGDLLPSIPEGQNYLWHTARGGGLPLFGWRTRYWSFLLKIKKTLPSWTILAQPGSATGPFHWRNRKLSASEMCRLQTFPDGIVFNCGRTDIQRMIGNAVPSLLSEILARAISEQLLSQRPKKGLELLPVRQRAPRATAVRAVPERYYQYVGKHAEHPGEGKGPGANKRRQASAGNRHEEITV